MTIVQTVGESHTYSPLTQDGEITGSSGLPQLFLGYINGLLYTATSEIGTNVENDVEANTHGSGSGSANDVEADTHGNGSGGVADAGADEPRDDSAAPLCYICKTIAKEGTAAMCPKCNMHVKSLIQDYKCVEAAPAANDSDAAAPPLSLPPLNLLAKQHSLSEEEIGAGCVLPPQRRVTAQIMRHWGPRA